MKWSKVKSSKQLDKMTKFVVMLTVLLKLNKKVRSKMIQSYSKLVLYPVSSRVNATVSVDWIIHFKCNISVFL